MREEPTCVSLEDAVRRLLAAAPVLPEANERIPLDEALGRRTAADIYAGFDQPPFDRSPLDGYAVRSEDLGSACREAPAVLRVVGETLAGAAAPDEPLQPGQALRIMTGAPIPPGADCVVRQEDTDGGEETVRVYVSHTAFQNYCRRGEDVRKGTRVLRRGTRLTAAALGVLAMLGQAEVSVLARPVAGVLSTGDELVEPGPALPPGKIYNSNRCLLSARLRELGAAPLALPPCPDDPAAIEQAVRGTLERCSFLITTGGVSVGKRDYMPEVCRRLGGELLFHGVPMKPGAPALAFRLPEGLILCLSGNPFAAAATFELMARPVLRRMQGLPDEPPIRTAAVLGTDFPKASPGRRFLRARFSGGTVTLPSGSPEVHSSGLLSSFLGCNCFIDLPAGTPPLRAGQTVEVVLLEET